MALRDLRASGTFHGPAGLVRILELFLFSLYLISLSPFHFLLFLCFLPLFFFLPSLFPFLCFTLPFPPSFLPSILFIPTQFSLSCPLFHPSPFLLLPDSLSSPITFFSLLGSIPYNFPKNRQEPTPSGTIQDKDGDEALVAQMRHRGAGRDITNKCPWRESLSGTRHHAQPCSSTWREAGPRARVQGLAWHWRKKTPPWKGGETGLREAPHQSQAEVPERLVGPRFSTCTRRNAFPCKNSIPSRGCRPAHGSQINHHRVYSTAVRPSRGPLAGVPRISCCSPRQEKGRLVPTGRQNFHSLTTWRDH